MWVINLLNNKILIWNVKNILIQMKLQKWNLNNEYGQIW